MKRAGVGFFDSSEARVYRKIRLGVCREALRSRIDERPLEPDPGDAGVGKASYDGAIEGSAQAASRRQEAAF
jgi:hypothetical protein